MKKFLKRRFLPFLALLAIVITSLVLPIGAEVNPATAPEYESPVDWSDYPGSNLLPYPYAHLGPSAPSYTHAGVTYTLQDYGIIITSGVSLTSQYSFLYLVRDLELQPGTYSLSTGSQYVNITAWVKDRASGSEFSGGNPFTVPVGSDWDIDIYLSIATNYALNVTVYPMLNKGSTAQPYQPYLPYWLQQASNSGYSQGYQSGLVTGMDEASKGTNNLFYGCTMYLSFTDQSVFSNYTFTYDQLPFDKGVLRLGDLPGIAESDWSLGYINVRFEWPSGGEWYYPSGNIKSNVSPSFLTARVLNPPVSNNQAQPYVDGYVYFPNGENGEFGTVEFDYNYYYISSLTFQDIGGHFLNSSRDIAFVSNSYQYTSGYSKGYADGLSVSSQRYIEEGYAKGINVGYKQGFAEGKEVGMQSVQSGDFNNLMTSVIDAPLRVITGLLDFEILGMNMLNFLGSLLTLCLVVIFLKKVVM